MGKRIATVEDLIGSMAYRARQLEGMGVRELRLTHPDANGESMREILSNTRGESRGKLMEAILMDEYEGMEVEENMPEKLRPLDREKGETQKGFAGRQLARMFELVYAHTGREMPQEMYDECYDFVGEVMDAAAEEGRRR